MNEGRLGGNRDAPLNPNAARSERVMEQNNQTANTDVKQPTPFGMGERESLRRGYPAFIREVAERCCQGFLDHTYRGFSEEDLERESGNYRLPKDQRWVAPRWRLFEAVEQMVAQTDAAAYLVLAASPNEENVDMMDDVRAMAAEAACRDVLAVAFAEGWYQPGPTEEPSARELQSIAACLAA
jgi:hypothetical protein